MGALLWAALIPVSTGAVWGLAWWALVAAMLLTHLGMIESESGAPRTIGPANALTLARAWAVPVPALLIGRPAMFGAVLAAAVLSDVLDGRLARRGADTRLGAQMDHAVDMAFAAAAAVSAAVAGWIPWWLAVLVVARQAAPLLGLAIYYFARAAPPPRERFIGARVAGGAVVVGVALAAAEPLRAVGIALVTIGVAAGMITLAVSARRSVAVGR